MATKQTKRPNTRNKKTMQARAAASAVAASRDFLELKSPEAQAVYATYMTCISDGASDKETIAAITQTMLNELHLVPEVAENAAKVAYERFVSGAFQNTLLEVNPTTESDSDSPLALRITLSDYWQITTFCASLPDVSTDICRLLLALTVFYRYHYHPSNWVRYDRKNIFYLAGLHRKPVASQEALTQYLHVHCGLQMRVVGSNQPIVCYDCEWLHDQPTPGDVANPFLNLGPMTPTALAEAVTKLLNVAQSLPEV